MYDKLNHQQLEHVSGGQAVQLHPDFWDVRDGVLVCIVRIDGTDYITERVNIAL
jgi:hypothetical protein